jgi:hypothetical protein
MVDLLNLDTDRDRMECIREMVDWFRKNDGNVDEFGRLIFVAKGERLLKEMGIEP